MIKYWRLSRTAIVKYSQQEALVALDSVSLYFFLDVPMTFSSKSVSSVPKMNLDFKTGFGDPITDVQKVDLGYPKFIFGLTKDFAIHESILGLQKMIFRDKSQQSADGCKQRSKLDEDLTNTAIITRSVQLKHPQVTGEHQRLQR